MKRTKRNGWLVFLAVIILVSCWGLKAQAASNFIYDIDDVHDGTVGLKYEATIYYHGYQDKLKTATVSSGKLPDGLSYQFKGYDNGLSYVEISGTPTKAGTYSFKITAVSENGKTVESSQFKVTIASSGTKFSLSLTSCTAKHADGTTDTSFRAGEMVTLVPKDLSKSQFVSSWKNDAGLNILAGDWITLEIQSDFSIWEKDTFIMPAKKVSIQCIKQNKDLGTLTLDPTSATKADYACGRNGLESLLLAKSYYNHDATPQHSEVTRGTFFYYYVDLDHDGTLDLELMDFSNELGRKGSDFSCTIKAMKGRSVYGTYTITVPKDEYWYLTGETGLYSKIVLNMGAAPCPKSSSGHKIQGVSLKSPTCTKDGWRFHYECTACGKWFADAAGKTEITNKDSYILKAMGHKWSPWTVVKEATETEEGLKERYCYNNNNHKEQETLPKLEPKPTEPPTTEAATTEAPTEPPTTEAPTTEAPATEAPTTEAPTEPETTEAPTEPETTAAPTEPETTAAPTEPVSTAAPTEAPTQAPTEAPKPTEPDTPTKSGGGNTVLYILVGVLAVVSGLLGGILIGKKNKKSS